MCAVFIYNCDKICKNITVVCFSRQLLFHLNYLALYYLLYIKKKQNTNLLLSALKSQNKAKILIKMTKYPPMQLFWSFLNPFSGAPGEQTNKYLDIFISFQIQIKTDSL